MGDGKQTKKWFWYSDYGLEDKQAKNFETNDFTESMYQPFQKYPNNALGHYYLQLPFYGKLLLEMLKGSKYEDTKLLGCVVVLLKESGDYVEYKVPQDVVNIIMGMNMKDYLKK